MINKNTTISTLLCFHPISWQGRHVGMVNKTAQKSTGNQFTITEFVVQPAGSHRDKQTSSARYQSSESSAWIVKMTEV
jgi:hypothetical protein